MSDATKNPENIVQRRRASDWKPRQPWTDQEHDEATTKADSLSMKAYGLASMLKVCAFAAEARRTLDEIELALSYRDKVREDLRAHVNHMTNWQGMQDAKGDALQYIAQELTQAMEESVNLTYGLASRLCANEQASSKPQAQGRAA